MISQVEKQRYDTYVFESGDVIRFTGIPATYLNKFIERPSLGIKPSIREGTGRGSRRLFSREDLLGIALVWSLFRTGLRSNVIGQVLRAARQIETEGLATDAAWAISQNAFARDEGPHVLVIQRSLERGRKKGKDLHVLLENSDYELERSGLFSELVIPVDALFDEVDKKIQRFSPERRV